METRVSRATKEVLIDGGWPTVLIGECINSAGMTCLIADVAKVRPMVLAADLLLGRDERARRYIEAYRERLR